MSENIREIVLDILLIHESEQKKSHLLIRDVLNKYDYLDARDKGFIKRVSEGTIAEKIKLDYILNKYSKKSVDKLKPVVRALLRMSAYQILFLEKVPDSAACDEAVKLCRKRSFEEFVPFVNGVLRNISKNKVKCLDFSNIEDEIERLSVMYSCPDWIVRMFKKEQHDAEALLASLNTIRPTSVKIIDESKKDVLLDEWRKCNISFEESRYVPNAYLISDFEGLESVPGFSDGCLLVQDESSMIACEAAGVKKGDDLFIIDTCAAPGGKTSCVAAKMNPKGKVISCDVSDAKVDLIFENVERMGLSNVTPMVCDATVLNEEFVQKADIVIADVPCSGLGVMSRKSDIKYNISNEGMRDLCALQKTIVKNVSNYLKPGGVLIYSTCTIHKAENEKMVKFIKEELGFEGDSLKRFMPVLFEKPRESEEYLQLLPHVDETDGFFVARFIKKV